MRLGFWICLAALSQSASVSRAQEWYIPKRTALLERGSAEIGARVQMTANNDGLLDSMRVENVNHVRYAPLRRLEIYVELPLVYAEREDVVNFNIVKNQNNGIGDLFSQLSFEGFSGEDWKLLYNLDGAFPTGKSPYTHRIGLGGGHFVMAAGQTAMKVIDPVVLFNHIGYQHTFPRRTPAGYIAPGRDIRFRFGASLALNPRVQTTLHVTSDLIATAHANRQPIPGSSGTLVRLGWGIDWTVYKRLRLSMDAAFGMTKNTPDATLSIGGSYRF